MRNDFTKVTMLWLPGGGVAGVAAALAAAGSRGEDRAD